MRPASVAPAVAVLVLAACATAVVVVGGGAATDPAPDRSAPADVRAVSDLGRRSRVGQASAQNADGSAAAVVSARGPVVRAAAVLRAWDARRARAWAKGDVDGLRDLYVDGAGAADVRLLRRYAERGYRVEGMATQLLAVEVVGRAPGRWRLRVTDRLADAVAVRGHERIRLPRDRADTHTITLVRGDDGRWRVARARPV